jgi:hypothetical protein
MLISRGGTKGRESGVRPIGKSLVYEQRIGTIELETPSFSQPPILYLEQALHSYSFLLFATEWREGKHLGWISLFSRIELGLSNPIIIVVHEFHPRL